MSSNAPAHLRALCTILKDDPLKNRALLAPSMAAGLDTLEAAAALGTEWINVKPVTLYNLALSAALPELDKKGITPASEIQTRALLEECIVESSDVSPDSHGMISLIRSAVLELRAHGIRSGSLPTDAYKDRGLADVVRKIMKRFEEKLSDCRLADRAEVFETAAKQKNIPHHFEEYLVLPGAILNPCEEKFYDAAVGHRALDIPGDMPIGLRPGRLTGAAAAPATILCALPEPQDLPKEADPSAVKLSFFSAAGPYAEIRTVLDETARLSVPLDNVEIVASNTALYGEILYALSKHAGFNATFADGLPLLTQKEGRTVELLLRWIEDDFHVKHIVSGFSSGDLTPPPKCTVSGTQCASILMSSKIGWNIERYAPCLKRYAEQNTDLAEPAHALADLFVQLASSVPQEKCTVAQTAKFLKKAWLLTAQPDLSTKAASAIDSVLEALSVFRNSTAVDKISACAAVRKSFENIRTEHSKSSPAAIHMSGFSSAGFCNRKVTFFVGMDASAVKMEEPVNPFLPWGGKKSKKQAARLFNLCRAAACARGKVIMSYSSTDPSTGSENPPSTVLLNAVELAFPEKAGRYHDMIEVFRPVKTAAFSDFALTHNEKAALHAAAEKDYALDKVFPNLSRAREAEEKIKEKTFTKWEGLVGKDPSRDPRKKGAPALSPARMETLGTCPLKYFFRYVLGVKEPEEMERSPAVWLSPKERGDALHRAMKRYMEEYANTKAHNMELAEQIAVEVLNEKERDVPPPSESVKNREMREFLEAVRFFVTLEEKNTHSQPVMLEQEFKTVMTCASGEEVEIEGRIDRIDLAEDGTYIVYDYKTGSSGYRSRKKPYNGGRQLQPAIYAAAAEKLTGKTVSSSGYYFPTPKGEGEKVMYSAQELKEVKSLVDKLCDLAFYGAFIPTESSKDCTYCPYKTVCSGRTTADRAKQKYELDDSPEAKLLPSIRKEYT